MQEVKIDVVMENSRVFSHRCLDSDLCPPYEVAIIVKRDIAPAIACTKFPPNGWFCLFLFKLIFIDLLLRSNHVLTPALAFKPGQSGPKRSHPWSSQASIPISSNPRGSLLVILPSMVDWSQFSTSSSYFYPSGRNKRDQVPNLISSHSTMHPMFSPIQPMRKCRRPHLLVCIDQVS